MSEVLDDGTYDAIVVDADPDGADDHVRLELTITSGPRKGQVVAVRATNLGVAPLDALGLPATLVVRDGRPCVVLDT